MREFWLCTRLEVWKIAGFLSKTLTNFVCFLTIPGKQQHFNFTNRKLVYCLHGELIFLSYKINLKTVSKLFVSLRYTRNFGAKRDSSTNTLYILHIYKQLTEYISKIACQQAGGDSVMPKNVMRAQLEINQANDILALFITILRSLQAGVLGMRRKLRSKFFPLWSLSPARGE